MAYHIYNFVQFYIKAEFVLQDFHCERRSKRSPLFFKTMLNYGSHDLASLRVFLLPLCSLSHSCGDTLKRILGSKFIVHIHNIFPYHYALLIIKFVCVPYKISMDWHLTTYYLSSNILHIFAY